MSPPSTSSDKSRQSSASKSFFGRKLHKDRPAETREGGGGLDATRTGSASSGSRSSRHSKRESVQSVDSTGELDSPAIPLSGIITAIPYDSVLADPKSPIPVDYLPKSEPQQRREPAPHHLGKNMNDFHQYPPWNPQALPNSSSHLTGPRPPPSSMNSNTTPATSSASDRGTRYQQPGNQGHNYPYGSTTDSSTNSRTSLDQTSVYSTVSSTTRGSTHFPADNSSRTYPASSSYERYALSSGTSASGGRNSSAIQSSWQPQQPPFSYTPTLSVPSNGILDRPKDDRVVDQMFYELMIKRGWQNLPEQAKRQMLSYPASKKWTLVHQDRLAQWQSEQKRRQHARQTYGSADVPVGLLGRADEEGSPEWYVKKVMDDTITTQQLGSLSVSLRTQPIR